VERYEWQQLEHDFKFHPGPIMRHVFMRTIIILLAAICDELWKLRMRQ
jgi:hypothetical protein